jgi:hypothetical protein
MYDCCNSQTAWSDHNIFDLSSSHFDIYCFLIYHYHDWSPQVPHYDTTLMPLHVIKSLWSHESVPMMGRSLELSLVLNTFLWNHTPFMMRCLRHPPK